MEKVGTEWNGKEKIGMCVDRMGREAVCVVEVAGEGLTGQTWARVT